MRKPSLISVRIGKSEFLKINADRFDWHDTYHGVFSLSWPQFGGLATVGFYDGYPNLMIRVANPRHHTMAEAEFA